MSHDGNIIWQSEVLGIDGVTIHDIKNGVIRGEYCWDPPEEWRPFAVSLDSLESSSSPRMKLKFRFLPGPYVIVRLAPDAAVPTWATKGEFTSITRTVDEFSIVCPIENFPPNVTSPHRCTCLKLEGPFPFSLTGVLLSFIEPLSNNGIPIFAISTFDTDYVLIQEEFAGHALNKLQEAGHELQPRDES